MPSSPSPVVSGPLRRRLRAVRNLAALLAFTCTLVTVLVVLRLAWSSRVELRLGQARLQAGDAVAAVIHWERAVRLRAPGNPFAPRARELLITEARTAPEPALRLQAWRAVHAALVATDSPLPRSPSDTSLLAEARVHIAELAAQLESPAIDPAATEAARARWHAARLATLEHDSVRPSPVRLLTALAGLLLLLVAALGFFRLSLDEHARLRPPVLRRSLGPALGLLCGLLLFLSSLA